MKYVRIQKPVAQLEREAQAANRTCPLCAYVRALLARIKKLKAAK
jgi:hypothetical protein